MSNFSELQKLYQKYCKLYKKAIVDKNSELETIYSQICVDLDVLLSLY